MMTLMIGGSGSGKSSYAESYLQQYTKERRYYLATMQVFDQEGQEKIDRHKELRRDKGFITIEQQRNIEQVLRKMDKVENTALLECMSNLVANEMFSQALPRKKEWVVEGILQGVRILMQDLTHLVIVSNNVFEDGSNYDETTREYMQALGKINIELSAMADEVIEVVAGIPCFIKKR